MTDAPNKARQAFFATMDAFFNAERILAEAERDFAIARDAYEKSGRAYYKCRFVVGTGKQGKETNDD